MKKYVVGVRFAPTAVELIIFYLMNKIRGYTDRVEEAINEIDFLSYEPRDLPPLAKIDSGDLAWYFFSVLEYADKKKTKIQRTIASGNGVWKSSGKDRTIKGERGIKGQKGERRIKDQIGIKKTFVYYEIKDTQKVRTPWVMHEYHITCLSKLYPELSNYVQNVVCKVMYNGEDEDITFGGDNQSGQSQPFVSSDRSCNMRPINTGPEELGKIQEDVSMWDIMANTLNNDNNNRSVQPEVPHHLTPDDAKFIAGLIHVDPRPVENLFSMKHDFNVHIPKKPLSGSCNMRPTNTGPEVQVEQAAEDCLSLDDLRIPLNVEEDHVPLDAFDLDTFFDDNNFNMPQQTPDSEDYSTELFRYNGGDYDAMIAGQELIMQDAMIVDQELIMQENRNVYRPRKASSGIIVDCSSDSDCGPESISAMSYQGTSSPHDSVGSSNKHFLRTSSTDSCKDLQTSGDLSVNRKSPEHQRRRRTIPSKQEVKRGTSRAVNASIEKKTSMVKTKKKGWFILEETMERNHKPRYIYLMNIITCFILLVGLIGNIKF